MNLSDVTIIKLLPPNLANDVNVRILGSVFDKELRKIIADIPGIAILSDLVRRELTDNLLLDLLAWQFHCDFYDQNFSIEKKQELILKSLDWHTRKGTPSVVEEVVSTVFSKAIVQEWHEYGGLPYRFSVATDEQLPDKETRNNFYRAINSVKNTRSFFDALTQLVHLIDEIIINEKHLIELEKNLIDNFGKPGIMRNGRILRDGKTAFNKELPVADIISPPFLRNTWNLQEIFDLTFDYGKYEERQVMNECFDALTFGMPVIEKAEITEQSSVVVGFEYSDTLTMTDVQRNMKIAVNGFEDNVSSKETMKTWYRNHHFRNGVHLRNGKIKHDSMIFVPLE